jgi:type I restriction enzyme M protein
LKGGRKVAAENKDQSIISSILQTDKTGYGLSIFEPDEIKGLEQEIHLKNGKPYVKCFVSDVERQLKPEEIVRQLFARNLVKQYGYPKERLEVEKTVQFGGEIHEKRADIVVYYANGSRDEPYIIVELKRAKRKDGEKQLKSYCNAEGSPIGVWTNGQQKEIWHREGYNNFISISHIPMVDQTLEQVIAEPWTIDRLTKENKLLTEKKSLREIIVTLENLVLANSGQDSFDEVFKLIYTKLYDEWAATNIRARDRRINFRIYGENLEDLYNKMNALFAEAKNKWRGVFNDLDKIDLKPSHLKTCVSFLQDIKLFNSNLYVIDEAFEYLVTQVAKGSKGQYFTPRHVIDMCIRMLNPRENEFVIDPAAGSCGFTVHTIFHIAGQQFTNQRLPDFAREFAQNNVFGIDFDNRAIKVAKALNLIAGDGKSNVYKANSLDGNSWTDDVKAALQSHLARFPDDSAADQENQRTYRKFTFEVLLTNPPFAGPIEESSLLKQYKLARNSKGKLKQKVERDTLFLERAFDFIKAGGRMAIVLPQGKYNNTNEEYIRDFVMEHGRLLAVVGLDENTFRPHTGTKTSVLFVQKWHDQLCPRKDDYSIFFATSKKTGKDNSGNYIFLCDATGEVVLDEHGHPKVDHDLGAITDNFIAFAKENKLSFWA